jgi:hypothetical protein
MKLASECPARQRRKKGEGTNGCASSRGCYGREESRWELSTVTMARERGAGWKGGMAGGSRVGVRNRMLISLRGGGGELGN